MDFKLGELFCGPGGLALGAALAKKVRKNGEIYSISHLWGVDKDEVAIKTYQHNIGDKYNSKGIPLDANEFCKDILSKSPDMKVNALAFGFPCNDFSLVGKQKGIQGKFGNLYKAGIKVIEICDPDWFIAENVSGIHSANSGKAFNKILHELENAGKGYELTTHLYKFELYGVPQYRHRYIIVGIRKDLGLKFKVPRPTHTTKPSIDTDLEEMVSVSKAFSKIPKKLIEKAKAKPNDRVFQRLKFIPPWYNAWYLDELEKIKPGEIKGVLKEVLPWYDKEFKSITGKKILSLIDYSKLNCKRARMSHIYRRLDPDQPSYTITGSGGGGTHVYHWNEHRALTNIERAIIQGFDENFEFKGTKEEVRKQIGMAVPPTGAKIIFEAILKTFAGVRYKGLDDD